MPEKPRKGFFDFASAHPFITLFAIGDITAMVANIVASVCNRGKNDVTIRIDPKASDLVDVSTDDEHILIDSKQEDSDEPMEEKAE